MTLGLGKTYTVVLGDKTVRCKTVFQMFAEQVGKYTPKVVCRLCEIPFSPEKIVDVARELGKNRPSVIFFPGFTSGRYTNWFHTLRAYSVVNLLLGNLDTPGGFYFLKHKFDLGTGWPKPPEVPEYRRKLKLVPGPWENLMSIETIDKEPCFKEPREFHPGTQSLPWLHFDAIQKGKVRAVLSTAENSAVTQPDSKWVWKCLKELDLIVVGEQVPKEFVDLADYVIPEASYLERYHLYQYRYIGVDDKEYSALFMRSEAIRPQGESRPLSWFLIEVAKRVGLEEYFEELDLDHAWWDRMLKNAGLYPKITTGNLIKDGPYVQGHPLTYDILFKPIATHSGRFEIYSNELGEECYFNPKSRWHRNSSVNPLPIYISIAEPRNDNEFYFVCGKATWHQKSATQNNRHLMEDAIEGGCPYTPIYINADRAEKLGLKDGDLVEVECVGPSKKSDPCVYSEMAIGHKERGSVKVTEGLHPKTAWTYFAASHKSNSMMPKAREGVTANWLIPFSVSPYNGGVGKNYSIVKIRKISE